MDKQTGINLIRAAVERGVTLFDTAETYGLYGPGDGRFEERPEPKILQPTDAIIRLSATCVCGSDLWPYRGLQPIKQPQAMGHEYCGIIEEVGSQHSGKVMPL